MSPIMNGKVYCHSIDGWTVSWESNDQYRHWCRQEKDGLRNTVLFVMFNPGSLSGDGSSLTKDTTLRTIREVTDAANLNSFVINLFDYACPKPEDIFNNWDRRDSTHLIFSRLNAEGFCGYIMAYGDYENWGKQDQAIRDRASLVRSSLSGLKELQLKTNDSGTPMHPMRWKLLNLKAQISAVLLDGTK